MHKNEHDPSVKSVSRYLEWKQIWSEEKQRFKNLTILTSLWPSIKSNQIGLGLLAPNKQQQNMRTNINAHKKINYRLLLLTLFMLLTGMADRMYQPLDVKQFSPT